jgi:hypothetical protein
LLRGAEQPQTTYIRKFSELSREVEAAGIEPAFSGFGGGFSSGIGFSRPRSV